MSEKRVDKSKEGKHPIRSFLSFLLMLAAVLLVVLLAAYRDGTGFDILRRYLHYGRAEQAGGETVYHYDASSKNRFALLGESLDMAKSAGYEQAELEAVSANEPAIALYRKFGFETTGTVPRAFRYGDGTYADFLFMVKRLL